MKEAVGEIDEVGFRSVRKEVIRIDDGLHFGGTDAVGSDTREKN